MNAGMRSKKSSIRGIRFCLLLLLWEGFFCPCHGLLSLAAEAGEKVEACCNHCAAEREPANSGSGASHDSAKCEEGCCAPCLFSEKTADVVFPVTAFLPISWSGRSDLSGSSLLDPNPDNLNFSFKAFPLPDLVSLRI